MSSRLIAIIAVFAFFIAVGAVFFIKKNIAPEDTENIVFQEQLACTVGNNGCSANTRAGVSSEKSSQDKFAAISSRELATALERKDFFLVNVHIPYEGEIKNTDAFIPYDKVADNLGKLPQDKNAKIVLYCRSGRMSEIAAKELAKLGYANISHLAGGMIDWEKNGYEIIKK